MKSAKTFDVECPCCQAKLTIDTKLQALLSHEEPPGKKAHLEWDLGDAAKKLKDLESHRDSIFSQQVAAQKKEADVLSRKFEEQFKKVKDQPVERPTRDFDYD